MTMWRLGSSPSERVDDPGHLVDGVVHRLAVGRAHGLEGLLLARGQDLLGDLEAEPLEGGRAALPVARHVDQDPVGARRALALHHGPGEVLQGGSASSPGGRPGCPRSSPVAAISTVSSSRSRVSTVPSMPNSLEEAGHERPPDLALLFERHSLGHVHCLLRRFCAPLRSPLGGRSRRGAVPRVFPRPPPPAARLAAIAPAPRRAARPACRVPPVPRSAVEPRSPSRTSPAPAPILHGCADPSDHRRPAPLATLTLTAALARLAAPPGPLTPRAGRRPGGRGPVPGPRPASGRRARSWAR